MRQLAFWIVVAAIMTGCVIVGCAGGSGGGGGGSGGGTAGTDGNGTDGNDTGGNDPDGNDTDGSDGVGQGVPGCGADPTGAGGANPLPHYEQLPDPDVPRKIREGERPAEVDLSTHVPTPCNQGYLASCAGWSGGYSLMTYLAAASIDGWVDLDQTDRHFSPSFIFNQANEAQLSRSLSDSCYEAGTFVTDMLSLIRDTGCATWAHMPYTEYDCETQPDADAIEAAGEYKIPYFRSTDRDVDTIQSYLNEGIPVVITLVIGDTFVGMRAGGVLEVAETDDPFAHAVLAVGYDDDVGAIKVMNSWGTYWGDGGFGFISYDVWEDVAYEAFVVGNELAESDGATTEKAGPGLGLNAQANGPTSGCAFNPMFDTDGDGYPDTLEREFGLDPAVPDDNPDFEPLDDADGDGWPDETEITFGTDPESAEDFPFDCSFEYREGFFDQFLGLDDDGDFVRNDEDNCPDVPNPAQQDSDGDGVGDVCEGPADTDSDDDRVPDGDDNCPETPNPSQTDTDGDGQGDACDSDDDGDEVPDAQDNCRLVVNADQADVDTDGIGDACEEDTDGDGLSDELDNCPQASNADQVDTDTDGIGDACDEDDDGDGVADSLDNCPQTSNADQVDTDTDGMGDACDDDDDGDGVSDELDNCPQTPNADQVDTDTDGIGDACELSGACCLADGSCDERAFGDCVISGGDYQGDGTSCASLSLCPTLLGMQSVDATLRRISRFDASTNDVRRTLFTSVQGLTRGPADEMILYGVRRVLRESELVRIAVDNTATDETVGTIGFPDVRGLAYDSSGDILYGMTDGGRLLTIDKSTGDWTELAVFRLFTLDSLAFDSDTGLLYTARYTGGPPGAELRVIDPGGAVPTIDVVGEVSGHTWIGGMTFFQGTLYAVTQDTQRLIAIDVNTNPLVVTDIGPLSSDEVTGLAAYEEP
jgi:hypothetical protein